MWALLLILCCILSEAFFSGSEIALVSLSKVELKKRLKEGESAAVLLDKLLRNPEKLLVTTLIGTDFSTVTGSVIYTHFILSATIKAMPSLSSYPELLTVLTFTPITLTFGELVPKSLFQHYSSKISFKIAHIIYALSIFFKPISIFVMFFANLLGRLFGANTKQNPFVTKKELQMLVESPSKLKAKKVERDILKNILDLKGKNVGYIYVPLLNIVAVNVNSSVREAIKLLEKTGFSKLPIYRERFDDIVGYVSISDLFDAPKLSCPVREFMKPILVFPEYMNIFDALKEFKKTHTQMAIVVDEYGSTLGIITVEDILEEVVGNIEDEFDRMRHLIEKNGRSLIVSGMAEIDEINRRLKNPLPEEDDYSTIAGLVLSKLGRIPKEGEIIDINGNRIEVLQTDRKRLLKLKITKIERQT